MKRFAIQKRGKYVCNSVTRSKSARLLTCCIDIFVSLIENSLRDYTWCVIMYQLATRSNVNRKANIYFLFMNVSFWIFFFFLKNIWKIEYVNVLAYKSMDLCNKGVTLFRSNVHVYAKLARLTPYCTSIWDIKVNAKRA